MGRCEEGDPGLTAARPAGGSPKAVVGGVCGWRAHTLECCKERKKERKEERKKAKR